MVQVAPLNLNTDLSQLEAGGAFDCHKEHTRVVHENEILNVADYDEAAARTDI